ncbi:MAG: 3-hydroxyacyl-CoA dehydrogenase NAD-binding domain-containing protein [Pseudomonadota bacterium]
MTSTDPLLAADMIIGVCGAGTMGTGIAQVAAQAGHHVVVFDTNSEMLTRARATLDATAKKLFSRGKLNAVEAEALAARVRWTNAIEDLASAGLVIEAIVEKPEVKTDLFSQLEVTLATDAVIATNTSSLSVTELAASLTHPERFLGLHFFNPAPIMKLVEVVPALATGSRYLNAATALMTSWGKVAVVAKDVPGFIVNRAARPFYGEGWRAYEEGAADAATIDYLYRELGRFRMGPLELGDLIGHDINGTAARSVFDAYFGRTRFTPSLAQQALVAGGRLGRKSGLGVYEYGESAPKPVPQFDYTAGAETTEGSAHTGIGDLFEPNNAKDFITFEGVLVGYSSGFSARAEKAHRGQPVVIFECTTDGTCTTIACAVSCDQARQAALSLAQATARNLVIVKDRPGLIVFRTWLQLLNAAADILRDQVAAADSVDQALMYGVNYPMGPFGWAKQYGFTRAVAALDNIATETGNETYRPNEVLRDLARGEG